MTQVNPIYAISSIASKNGNEKLMAFATYLFVGLGAVMLVKELKELIRDDKKGHFKEQDRGR